MIPSIVCYYYFLLFLVRHLCLYLYYCLFYVYPYSLSITLFFLYPSHLFLHSYLQIYIHLRPVPFLSLSYYIMSYYILSCYIMLNHILLYPIIFYHMLSYPSYLVPNTSPNLVLSQSFRLTSMP